MMTTPTHIPVALERTLELLAPALQEPGALVVDMTVGLGGHAEALLDHFPHIQLLGIDRDPRALALSAERLAPHSDRLTLVHARYDELADVLSQHYPSTPVRGILLDAGVSSMQLDLPERGFSYMAAGELDMRMNQESGRSAADLVNSLSEAELADLFRRYGDEPLALRYARAIVTARADRRITTTDQLVNILDAATPAAHTRRGHSAKRVFQALRVAVNNELESLEAALPQALDALDVGGRIVVLSYQSGEDRLVKHLIERRASVQTPVDVPVVPESDQPTMRWVVKGPESASAAEQETNPRSQSVRLRAAEKIRREVGS